MRKLTRVNVVVSLLLLALTVISTGCQVVNVKDKEGKAIAFAKVSSGVQGTKYASSSALTDAFGNAFIIKSTTESNKQWVAISKEGYLSRRISRATEGKIEVTLQKTAASGRRYTKTMAVSGRGKSETINLRADSSQNTPSNNATVGVPRKYKMTQKK